MTGYIVEWLNLLGRWVHVITGIAWIGASFYFVWLDNHLHAPKLAKDREKGVAGELWAVHGGGFYNAQKYQVAPEKLPETLHWFKWEAYSTWLSGMFMLVLMYWYSAELYLIDPSVMVLAKPVAIMIGFATLLVGWKGYDAICRAKWAEDERLLALVIFILTSLVAFLLCKVFSGRGAYIHYGAMLGTIMVANVYYIIIPGQKDLVKAKEEGREPDPIHGIRGKQRSVHNTYFTLPVLFTMISNHYAMTYAHRYNWLILIAISLAGALAQTGNVGTAGTEPAGTAGSARSGSAVAETAQAGAQDKASLDETVLGVVTQRCTGCHAAKPTYPGFYAPPLGIALESADAQDSDLHHYAATG